jgi:outer membrane lipoprotein-sorting protein
VRGLLISVLLCCVTPTRAEDRAAERLLRKMEEKLGSAKVLKVAYEVQNGESRAKVSGTIFLAEGNKLRWEERVKNEGAEEEVVLIADGKSVALLGLGTDPARPVAVAADLGKVVLQAVARQGAWTLKEVAGAACDAKAPGRMALPVGEFALRGKERVGKREAHVISYRLGIKGIADIPVTLWLDTQTGLPLKRRTGDGKEAVTETYAEIALEPKIDEEAFALREVIDRQSRAEKALRATEKSIRAAKALKVVVEAEQREGKEESRLKGSVVLGAGNRVRIELTRTRGGKTETMRLTCDGKQAVGEGENFDTEGKAVPVPEGEGLNEQLAELLARAGVLGLLAPGVTGPDGKFDIDLAAPLISVAPGAREKIDGREAEVFRVLTKMHRVRQTVTVWVDAKTHLPLKRVSTWNGGRLTETYTEFELDPRLDAGLFTLPKRK